MHRSAAAVLLASSTLGACEPRLSVGEWTCSTDGASAGETTAIGVPWSTSFENRFCDYSEVGGFCYGPGPARYEIVSSPVHSGRHAAAFSVQAGDAEGHQTRCVRQGALPTAAYYGAWFYLPTAAENSAVWNLVHFQGGDPSGQHGLWDISLVNTPDGNLQTVVFDFLGGMTYQPTEPAPVPIASWFHLELYLRRAADATGEVALYQDGRQLVGVTNIVTDDSSFGQWYVGNFATGLSPADSTIYVDDVSIRTAR